MTDSADFSTLESRTCATCAVSFLFDPPRIQADPRAKAPPPVMAPLRICRLNPPMSVQVQVPGGGVKMDLVQQVVRDGNTCWHWRLPGTLPGEG